MEIEKKELFEIKQIWKNLEQQKKDISPFQTYEFTRYLRDEYRFFCGMRGVPEFYLILENGNPVMICPVCRNHKDGKVYYTSFGSKMSVINHDFIYSDDISDEKILECLFLLLKRVEKVSFERVSGRSRLYSIALQNGMVFNENLKPSASIALPQSYEEWFKGLSKKMRQTIRSAHNRMTTDEANGELKIFYGKKMTKLEYMKFLMVYANSKTARYYSNHNSVRKLIHWVYMVFFHHHARAMNKIDSSVCVMYTINQDPAAILGGYLDKKSRTIYWHRIGFKKKYARYSPGIVLLEKTIEKMISENEVNNFDLTIDDEEYKFRMGAEMYYEKSFEMQCP